MGTMRWQPAWWNEGHASAWERVKEAMRRDWEQTKHDVSMKGGHELNQGIGDTLKQAAGSEQIPPIDRANPPKIVGEWNEVEMPIGYGYAARSHYATQGGWSSEVEGTLKREWNEGRDTATHAWDDVRDHVRHGFEAKR